MKLFPPFFIVSYQLMMSDLNPLQSISSCFHCFALSISFPRRALFFFFSKRNDRNALRQSNPRQHSTNSRVQLSQGELYDYQLARLSLSVYVCGCLNTLEKKPQAPTACAIILTFVSVIYY
jgi:hypothetical protein